MKIFGMAIAAAATVGLAFGAQAEENMGGDHGMAAPHWTYVGEAGSAAWGGLAPEFATCASGRSQSPIDLTAGEPAQMKAIQVSYKVTPLDVENNGHSIKVGYQPGSGVRIGAKSYALMQFHFHTPSEHMVNGASSPMEIHYVHQDASGNLAVVGVLVEEGQTNLAAEEILSHLPPRAGDRITMEQALINGRDLMPDSMDYYRYMGSLTTPPCTEGVNWYVLKETVQMSAEQISRLLAVMGENNRPVQPLNSRLLLDATSTR